ncbi:hypothetical protein BP6252_10333 [Coleophoma cylindrospora]|uniref:Zn(2)-C6 fungal-type domain-containing protein n=1 Tax=Coleophoma cylindrospora TaxID=1849047 RepID=A0A3D8QSC0_9HELO|nr:hypothetical protein BP6252_10333 [Coleophoma cylindrospora]
MKKRELLLVDRSLSSGAGVSARAPTEEATDQSHEHGRAPSASRRIRAKVAKVRTGCRNCKIRRVKCDEGQPGCQKCWKYGIYCSGYPCPSKSHQAESRDLAPMGNGSQISLRAIRPRHVDPAHLTLLPFPGGKKDEMESRYFNYYLEDIASKIGGPGFSDLWVKVIPQVGDTHPYIAQAMVALGALSRSRQVQDKAQQIQHREYALAKHIESLSKMRKVLSQDGYDKRMAMHACLLVFCFESLQGHQAAASMHAAGGVSLLESWNQERKFKGAMELGDTVGDNASLSYAIACLDFQALAFLDARSADLHEHTAKRLKSWVRHMPNTYGPTGHFKSLDDCRTYGHMIMRRTFHFISTVRIYLAKNNRIFFMTNADGETACLHPGNNTWTSGPLREPEVPKEMLQEYEDHMEDIRRWQVAAAPVIAKARTTKDSDQFTSATISLIRCTLTIVTLAGAFIIDEAEYDKYIADFREITTLVTSVWATVTKSRNQFTFQTGMLPALLLVSMHCRDREIRDQAIGLMRSGAGYREGIWDSIAIEKISVALRDLEEKWVDDDGHIPGEMRALLVSVSIILEEKTAQLVISQKAAPGDTNYQVKTVPLAW